MSEYSASAFRFIPMQPGKIVPDYPLAPSAAKSWKMAAPEFFAFDEDYLQRLVAGDSDTERHFVEYFSVLLRTKLQFRLRRAQDVDDLKQEVFLRVLHSLRRGRGLEHPGKLGAFVNAVCNNVLLEHFRSASRTSQLDEGAQSPQESTADLERELLSEEVRAQVRSVLEDLPAKDRTLLRAVFIEERDKDSVCKDYGVHRDYLRVLLHRARRRLRDLLPDPHPKTTNPAALRTSGGAH